MGNAPTIGLKVELDGIKSGADKLKAARAEVKVIQQEIAAAAKAGENVEKQFDRLKKAQDEVTRQKTAMKGGSPSGMGGGGSFQFSTGSGLSSGGGTYAFKQQRMAAGGGTSLNGISNGMFTIANARRAERGFEVASRAIGLSGLITAFIGQEDPQKESDDKYQRAKDKIKKATEADKKKIQMVKDVALLSGNPIAIAASQVAGVIGESIIDSGAKEATDAIGKKHITDLVESSGVTGYGSGESTLTARAAPILEQYGADDDRFKADLDAALADRDKAYKQAALGNLEPAAELANKSNRNFLTTRITPTEMYLNAQRVRDFNANYTQMFNKRGSPRTGDKD
jgi:hypothetical protein